MELEEAIRIMEEWSSSCYKEVGENDDSLAIDTVLQALENSIPTKKIEDKIEYLNDIKGDNKQSILDKIKLLQELLEDK